MSISIPNTPDKQTLQERLEAERKALLNIPDEQVLRPRVTHERGTELTRELLRVWATLPSDSLSIYSHDYAKKVEAAVQSLPKDLFVFLAAYLEASEPWQQKEKERFRALAKKVRRDDRLYMTYCRTLYLDDEDMNQRLDQIQSGRGHQDDAEDVVALTRILLSSKTLQLPNNFFTEQDLRQSQEDALQFIWLLKGRNEKTAAKSSPTDIWHRAYTHWAKQYEFVMYTGQHLHAFQGKNPQDFPKIHALTSTKSSPSTETAE